MSVPPVAPTSASVKSVLDSLSVNVIAAVSPTRSAPLEVAICTVGATVSIRIGGASAPATLAFPAASVNTPAATDTIPSAVELSVGTNVAE